MGFWNTPPAPHPGFPGQGRAQPGSAWRDTPLRRADGDAAGDFVSDWLFRFLSLFSPVPFYPADDCKGWRERGEKGRGGEGSNATRRYDTGVMAQSASFQSLSP